MNYEIKKLKNAQVTEVVTQQELDAIPSHFLDLYTVKAIPTELETPKSIADIVEKAVDKGKKG